MNMREVPSYYDSLANKTTKGLQSGSIRSVKKPTCMPTIGLLQFIVKQVPRRSGFVFESRAKCQDFVVRCKDNGIPNEIDSPFCNTKTAITVRQSKTIEDREIGKQFAPLQRELADQIGILFPNRDDEGALIIPALDTRSRILSIKDRRNGVGKPVFKLAPLGSGQTFALVTPELSVPGVPPDVLQHVLSQANRSHV